MLEAAEKRFGLGAVHGPQWVRDRVAAFLEAYVERTGTAWSDVAERLIAERAPMNELVASLRVGETRFLRDAPQWDVIVQHVCERVPPGQVISALSAGCSTGEEAYTLAILLSERKRRYRILGVDRSMEAIEAARRGKYSAEAARELPAALIERYFEQDGPLLSVRASLREGVTFEARDLTIRCPKGPFHLVLFKNVLLYLADGMGTSVATRLGRTLSDNGFLISAASEIVRLSASLDPMRLSPGVVAFRPRPEP